MKKGKKGWRTVGLVHVLAITGSACATIDYQEGEGGGETDGSGSSNGEGASDSGLGGASSGGRIASTGGVVIRASGGAVGSGGAIGSGGSMATGGSGSSAGGSEGSGGATGSGLAPEDCTPLELGANSGSFDTYEAKCFLAEVAPTQAWTVYNGAGRSIWINEREVTSGELPWPGQPPFMIDFSGGTYDYASWTYY